MRNRFEGQWREYHKSRKRIQAGVMMVLVLTAGIGAHAVEIGGKEIGVALDMTYASKYLWHGYDIFDDSGAWQPSITFSCDGFYVGIWGAFPDSSGSVNLTEIDLYGGYGRSFFEDEAYAIDAGVSYTYFTYPKTNSDGDVQEVALTLSMPGLLPLGESNLVPGYGVYYDWDGVQSSDAVDNGWFHVFSLAYDIPIPALLEEQESQAVSLSWDITYEDGVFGSESAWSHTTAGISTTFEWKDFYFTPAVNYQWSLEDSVNNEDDFYVTFSTGRSF